MQGAYSEWYRKDTLLRGLRIYDKMVEDDRQGVRPLYRPKDYDIVNRRNQKEKKRNNWSNRGGYIAPIFVPPTPQSELANQLKEIAETEAEGGIRFRIIEEEDCLPCRGGKGEGGDCRQCGVNYSVECQLCPDGSKSIYHGETARNLYTRWLVHEQNYRLRNAKSFMLKHQEKEHQGRPGRYKAKVTATAKDCLTRQVREAVHLRRSAVPTLNSKTEWHQPALFRIQREIFNG